MEVGRPSELTPELIFKIRSDVLEGLTYQQIIGKYDLVPETWDGWMWRNYKGLRDECRKAKHERMVRKAEVNLEVLMDAEDDRVKLDAAKFIASTLGKTDFSTKTETDITSGGKPLILSSEIIEKNNLNETPSGSEPNS